MILQVCLLISLLLLPLPCRGEELLLSFLDVGYGDAILIREPGGTAALLDTGYPEENHKLISWLHEHGIKQLDYLLLTHPHADHLGNAVEVLSTFQAKTVGDNAEAINRFSTRLTQEMAETYESSIRNHPRYFKLLRGRNIDMGQVTLEVIWPIEGEYLDDWNTNSTVIMLKWKGFRALLAADLNHTGEEILLNMKTDLDADLLKVGHHGAADSSSGAFLEAVSPRWGVISVGPNPWGTPDPDTLTRLDKSCDRLLQTPRDEDITFRIFQDGRVWIYTNRFAPLITRLDW